MEIIRKIKDLEAILENLRKKGYKIGLVPTMGALHEGHASLVKKSVEENDITVVSDFVNPTQFNDKGDLKRYPRTFDSDKNLLESLGTDYMFYPSVEEVYPEPDTRHFSYPPVDEVMEGARRPGHFNGVCQIVSKLFYIVKPDKAYFGEKDYQQIAVIKAMVKDLKLNVEICPCPVIREIDGLAKSSRNALLKPEEKVLAANIFKHMKESLEYAKKHTVEETHKYVVDAINAHEGLDVEYYEIVDGDTLLDIKDWNETKSIVGCITVYCGSIPVRLIDHIRYK